MKGKLFKLSVISVIFFFVIQSVPIAKADDHHHHDYYKHEKFKDHDDWDDDWDDDDWKNHYKSEEKNYGGTKQITQNYWNIWTRDTTVSTNDNLPIQEAKEMTFELDGKSEKLLVIPSNGQLLVSGEKMAKMLGVKYKFYEQSRIFVMSNNNEELIVRAGTNAAYENMVKTPIPTKVIYYEKSVFLPVSVISNAFGYSVDWNAEKSTFVLTLFN